MGVIIDVAVVTAELRPMRGRGRWSIVVVIVICEISSSPTLA